MADDVQARAAKFVTPQMVALRDQSLAACRDAARDNFGDFLELIHVVSTAGLNGDGSSTVLALATIGAHEVLRSIAEEGE